MNMTSPESPILSSAVEKLPLSEGFKAMAARNGFATVNDIVKTDIGKFAELPGSGYRMLKELMGLLKQHGLEGIVKESLG